MDSAEFLLGTVTAVSTSAGIKIQLDGQDAAMSKYYKILITGAEVPVIGERVAVMKHSGTYVVIGKIGMPSDNTGKVNRSGDTMTGALTMNGADINLRSTANTIGTLPATSQSDRRVYFRDKLNAIFGKLQSVFFTDGRVGVQLGAQRTVNSNTIENLLTLTVDANGNRIVGVSSALPWRNALGLGTNGNLPLTIAQGGTGNTGVVTDSTVASIATAATGWNITAAAFSSWGKIAMVELAIRTTQQVTVTANTPIATIVSGKRPALDAPARVWLTTARACVISTDGEVLLNSATIAADTGLYIISTYLLA